MVEKNLLLQVLDQHWKDHLFQLDHLKQGIGLRAYGQRDPLNEYRAEAFEMFESMLTGLRGTVTRLLATVKLNMEKPPEHPSSQMHETHVDALTGENKIEPELEEVGAFGAIAPTSDPSTWRKVARNASCPCGSGRKFKHCHGSH
jgi:preprotein translocase subunit SecA